jgi:hypothetical protein
MDEYAISGGIVMIAAVIIVVIGVIDCIRNRDWSA